MSEQKPSLFRRKYIVNPRFQYTLMISLILMALMGLVCMFITQYFFFGEFEALAERMGFPETHQFVVFIEHQKTSLIKLFIFASIINAFFIGLMGMFLSHNVAGPIYRIITSLEGMKAGSKPQKIKIRKNDMFQELPEAINSAMEKIHQ